MTRLRINNIGDRSGIVNPITVPAGAGTCSWDSDPGFPTITSPDYAVLVVEPGTPNEDIRYLTAFTEGETTGTVSGAVAVLGDTPSTGAAHTDKAWAHGPTSYDFDELDPDYTISERPGLVGAAQVKTGTPIAARGTTRYPTSDMVIGDSVARGFGANLGMNDWASQLATFECFTAGLPRPGQFIRGNELGDHSDGAVVADFTLASCVLGSTTTITRASGFPGVVPGQSVTKSSGTGSLSAGTYVKSVSGTNCVLNQAPETTGTATLSFDRAMTQGFTVPGATTSWKISDTQAMGDGVTKAGAAVTVASVTTTTGSRTATVTTGGFPGVSFGMNISGTGLAAGTKVGSIYLNTLTLDRPCLSGGVITMTFVRFYKRVQVFYAKQNNGDDFKVTTYGNGGVESATIPTHSETGGVGVFDASIMILMGGGIKIAGATHSQGAGGAGVIILGVRWLTTTIGGIAIDNVAEGASFVSAWKEAVKNEQYISYAQLLKTMAELGAPYRRIYILAGINDAALGPNASDTVAGDYGTIYDTVKAVSPSTEVVMLVGHYGSELTQIDSVTTTADSTDITSANFAYGMFPTPRVGSWMNGPGIQKDSKVLTVYDETPVRVTLDKPCTASGTITIINTNVRQGPYAWRKVADSISQVAYAKGATFIDLYSSLGSIAGATRVFSVTTTTGSNKATVTSGGFPGLDVGDVAYGTGLGQDPVVMDIDGNEITLASKVVTGTTQTMDFFEDSLGIGQVGGLHIGDDIQSLSGRDGHRVMAIAIVMALAFNMYSVEPNVWRTSDPSDGMIRANLPYNASGYGPSLAGYLSPDSANPAFDLRIGFFTAVGLAFGDGSAAVDSLLYRASAGILGINTALKIDGRTGAAGGLRIAGSTDSGPPLSGTFELGDLIWDKYGHIYLCTGAGTPGTWFKVGQNTIQQNIPGATPTVNCDTTDYSRLTGLNAAITSIAVTGHPVHGQQLTIEFTDNGTARAITFGSAFEASTVSLPTTTVLNVMLTCHFRYNSATSKWRLMWKA